MKKLTLAKLKKKAWKIYSQYIRIMSANPDGYSECVTCGAVDHWKKLQGGHFVSGRSARILFADKNVHPQCYKCNIILNGDWPNYFKFMKGTYGMKVIDGLLKLKDLDKSSPMSSNEIWSKCEEVIQLFGGKK